MAAQMGNNFWELRSKHGRDKLFETPDLMWEAACEYFKWCEENPLKKSEAKVISNGGGEGSSIEIIEVPVMRAFTWEGLCMYLGCNEEYFRNFQKQERAKKEDFSWVMSAIRQTIYKQKFEGAAGGLLNANIIARDLGLVEKREIDQANTSEIRVIYGNDKPEGNE